jgi:hypothetical protein
MRNPTCSVSAGGRPAPGLAPPFFGLSSDIDLWHCLSIRPIRTVRAAPACAAHTDRRLPQRTTMDDSLWHLR